MPKISFQADTVAGCGISESPFAVASGSVLNEFAVWMRNGDTYKRAAKLSSFVGQCACPRRRSIAASAHFVVRSSFTNLRCTIVNKTMKVKRMKAIAAAPLAEGEVC